MIYLEDGDVRRGQARGGVRIVDRRRRGSSEPHGACLASSLRRRVELGPYRHFMQKEIFEQPKAVANTLEMVTDARSVSPQLFGAEAERVLCARSTRC